MYHYFLNSSNLQEIKRVELKCAIFQPGVYNLNRFKIHILEDENQVKHNFVNEFKLHDDILINVTDGGDSNKEGAGNLVIFD